MSLANPWLRPVAIVFVLVALPSIAGAALRDDALDALNAIRSRPCEQRPAGAPLGHAAKLDTAARRVAEGQALGAAVEAAGYRAAHAALIRIDGIRDADDLRAALGQSCRQIAQPALREAGTFAQGRAIWIVLAEPFTLPTLEKAVVERRVLELVNEARARARRCGARDFAATAPVRWSSRLERAAAEHARDMAEHATMRHAGSDGSSPAQRVSRTGYSWMAVAENVAAGPRDAAAVVRGWLDSPGHCANLMGGEFKEMAVAFATNPASDAGIYWTQLFATPLVARPRR